MSLPPETLQWLDQLRAHEFLLPPLGSDLSCSRCQRPLEPEKRGFGTCYECGWTHGPALERVSAATLAAAGTKPWELLVAAKFQTLGADAVAERVRAIAAAIWEAVELVAPAIFEGRGVVVPIPSRHGLVDRCIAEARAQGWPDLPVRDCLRELERPRQTGLDAERRREAAAGKYEVVGDLAREDVLLVDDVYTTGFSMHDAARAVRAAGAASCAGVVYARRVYPDVLALYREARGV